MGKQLFDQYTLLHFSCGVIAYFWGVTIWYWMIAHVIFEILENTTFGMKFINETLTFWPGGKPERDSFINIIGDNLGAMVGWYCAKALERLGEERKWY
ncbi:MAG: hypothetical protein CMJ75_07420 [Planctomycetaceae bacterium]|nr:hypothetical protein [Planctomycetaceae bacterium]